LRAVFLTPTTEEKMIVAHGLSRKSHLTPMLKAPIKAMARDFSKRTSGFRREDQIELAARQTLHHQLVSVSAQELNAAVAYLVSASALQQFGALAAKMESVANDIDSLSEMSEMESLRLQMAMDRLSKLMSTLSNILKKTSDTASQITQNMK
jgi:hypothetical protein